MRAAIQPGVRLVASGKRYRIERRHRREQARFLPGLRRVPRLASALPARL